MFNHLDSFLTLGNYRTLFGKWTRAVAVALSKGHPTVIHPTRRSDGDDVTYPAIPSALSKLAAYGKAVTKRKQAALWGRYVPCDGITNGASTSIDTGIKAVDNIEMFCRVKAITGSFYMLHARQSSNATIYGISGSSTGNTILFFGVTSSVTRTTGHIYTIKGTIANGAITLYVKDETDGTEDTKTGTLSATYTFPSPTTIKLFGDANRLDAGATVYRAYIKVNGTVAWDMYPCVDVTNSNAPVAYDDVTHAASTVASGSITAGTLIQPISYAESDGTAWADTEIIPTTFDYTITYEGAIKTLAVGPNCAWGYMGNSGNNPRWLCATYNNSNYLLNANATESIAGADTNNHTFIAKVYDNNGTPYWRSEIDGVEKQNRPLSSTETWVANTLSIYLFARHNADGAGNKAPATLKRWICEKAGVETKHYIPVRVGQTVELLDLVNWTYATRTGNFTAGADVPYTELCPDIIETNAGDALYGAGKNLYNKSADATNKYFTNDGTESPSVVQSGVNFVHSDFTPVEPNTRYTLTGHSNITTTGYYYKQIFWDKNKQFISYFNGDAVLSGNYEIAINTPANCYYVTVNHWYTDDSMMLAKGNAAPYEPYHFGLHPSGAQTITVGDQTRTITTFLPSANSFIDAQKAANNAECDWKFKVLDGTESWNKFDVTQGVLFRITIADSAVGEKVSIGVLCNAYLTVNTSYRASGTLSGGSNLYDFINDEYTTVAEWKAHLAERFAKGDPIILAYPVATPEVTTVEVNRFDIPRKDIDYTIISQFADGTNGDVAATFLGDPDPS